MQRINNEVTVNADMVKFCGNLLYSSLHTKSHLLVKCPSYGAMRCQSDDSPALTDGVYVIYKIYTLMSPLLLIQSFLKKIHVSCLIENCYCCVLLQSCTNINVNEARGNPGMINGRLINIQNEVDYVDEISVVAHDSICLDGY